MARTLQIPIIGAGQLFTTPSVALENIPSDAFAEILNAFKDYDRLSRMPGWLKFAPVAAVANQYIFDGAETLLKLAELVRGDGTRWIVGASKTLIKAFNPTTGVWTTIGSGFSASGNPWQAEIINSTFIANNGVNLPVWWEIGEASVLPIHELREGGIASCGTIGIYNGFLFVGDVVEVIGGHVPLWLNGYGSYTNTATSAQAANFNIVAANNRVRFDVTTGAGTITATLPALGVTNWGFYVLIRKVDAGAGTVVTSPALTGETVLLDVNTDTALLFWNGTAWTAKNFPLGAIPGTDPYGIIDASLGITQYVPDEQAWSELGAPKNWAPLLTGYLAAASTSIVLPFKPFNWTAGKTRGAVIRGGPDGGTLGGQTLYPAGVLITAFAAFSAATGGLAMTIEVTTDVDLAYPRLVDVTRWTDVSTFVGKQRLGNGQRIIVMRELNGVQVIYHDGGIFLNRWTAQAKKPFALREKYQGKAVPWGRDVVASIRNVEHLYPSVEGSFITFDGISDPTIHAMCEAARDIFFEGLAPTDRCWAVDNPTLQSAWFIRPTSVMCYRYRRDTPGCSKMDAVINAAVFARKPGGTVDWFVLGIAGNVMQWGNVGDDISTWHRDGVSPAVPARITSGLNSFRTQFSEKLVTSFTPILASTSPEVALSVTLKTTHNPSAALTTLEDMPASVPDPDGNNYITVYGQGTYWQDIVELTDVRDLDFQLSARLFEYAVIGGVPITRTG